MIAPSLRQQLKVSLGNNISYQLREEDLELLCLFQVRTVSTVSTGEGLRIYQNEMIKLASSVRSLCSSFQVSHTDVGLSASIPNAYCAHVDNNA